MKQQILAVVDKAFRNPVFAGRVSRIAETVSRRVAVEVMQPFVYYVQTTDATATVIHTVELEDYEGGILDVDVLGMFADGSKFIRGKYVVSYKRTLSAGIVFEEILFNADGTLAIIEFVINGSEDIEIKVTGIAATVIDWNCYVIQKKILAAAP